LLQPTWRGGPQACGEQHRVAGEVSDCRFTTWLPTGHHRRSTNAATPVSAATAARRALDGKGRIVSSAKTRLSARASQGLSAQAAALNINKA
jgi:hypothetical protein